MARGARITLAAAILLAGASAAMLFRRDKPLESPVVAPFDPVPPTNSQAVDARPFQPLVPHRVGRIEIAEPAPGDAAAGTTVFSTQLVSLPPAMESSTSKAGEPFSENRLATASEPPRTHKVRDGDTLSELARRYLGRRERFLEIFAANRDQLTSPDLLPIGKELRIPPQDSASFSESANATSPATSAEIAETGGFAPAAVASSGVIRSANGPLHPPRIYRVQNEETLVQVAERVYGDATRYRDLYEANRDRLDSPQNLRPGLILVLP